MVRAKTGDTIYSETHTATSDRAFRVTSEDVEIFEANVHILDQGAFYGDSNLQSALIGAGNYFWFEGPFFVNDLWFRNQTPGQNTRIVIVATRVIPSE